MTFAGLLFVSGRLRWERDLQMNPVWYLPGGVLFVMDVMVPALRCPA